MYKHDREILALDLQVIRGLQYVDNDLWLCDKSLREVVALDEKGKVVKRFKGKDLSPNGFGSPVHIAYCDGKIAVVDRESKKIGVFDKEMQLLMCIETDVDSPQEHPNCVALNESYIAVVDRGEHQILLYDHEGNLVRRMGSLGDGDDKLCGPRSATFDRDGNIIVCDTHNHRIVVYSPEGKFIRTLGNNGEKKDCLLLPLDVKCDLDGNYVVVDAGNKRVKVYSPEGKSIYESSEMQMPFAVAVNGRNGFVISDLQSIQVYSREEPKSVA